MGTKCRIWWPKHLSSGEPKSSLLFGWFIQSSSASLDIVVAFAASPDDISRFCSQSGLQGILDYANSRMPLFLQDKSAFSVLGHCATDCSFNEQPPCAEMDRDGTKSNNYKKVYSNSNQDLFGDSHRQCSCERYKNKFLEKSKGSSGISNWIQLSYDSDEYYCSNIHWIPKFHHVHWSSKLVSSCDLHIIVYDPPTFGIRHFLVGSSISSEGVQMPIKRPKWVDKLHQKQAFPDLDTVVLAINCATAARRLCKKCMGHKATFNQFLAITCHSVAVFVASCFTLFYIILQLFHAFLSYGSDSLLYKMLAKVFSYTWKNVHIRSCQLLYWPIFLQDGGFRSRSSVEYAERASLCKHSTWSSIAVDVILGNMVGFTLLVHAETVSLWVSNLVHDITNNILRSGCVWLMGVPAGFKLNLEVAGILGMLSLNAIQIWSTLWIFFGFFFGYFLKGLAISGIILGATILASLIKDMIVLATFHISTLHWLVSLLYSQQIQALAALWRIFRGRKWNPLRQRFDSYDYMVEQHIVGSLLFTPLLLLLPTTSVFYIFFTIINMVFSCICILIEVIVSILHATPYAKIFLWMVKPRSFPCGIWFEPLPCADNKVVGCSEIGCINEQRSGYGKSLEGRTKQEDSKICGSLISSLQSNFSNIGEIILPHYRAVFCGISLSSVASSAYGLLIGRSEYWRLCRDSVITCIADHSSDSC
ncbi:PREDICTED: uncharacterized protein LOC104589577 isoform X2 [Nelumbo nucifera]|uniref:N-acetylglucosaminyl-phosphatidylinositol biosynthetic protein gpi1 n=2 Tax=Nelumbo nucifera TaxID=4432 RepID=A0A822YAQ0_NELNU|nr:PREDICTED: uncharacterized protein LOC104589577 isoform X2 [Nelumbo nucifera]DAD29507.1 TPA_asm: hypothetical protein HUJ06_030975 [Nelumbo nucifera]